MKIEQRVARDWLEIMLEFHFQVWFDVKPSTDDDKQVVQCKKSSQQENVMTGKAAHVDAVEET